MLTMQAMVAMVARTYFDALSLCLVALHGRSKAVFIEVKKQNRRGEQDKEVNAFVTTASLR